MSTTLPVSSRAPTAERAAAAPPLRLPLQLTSFIGREREIATVRQLLGQTRLLTLTGAGGSGKTRLALEVAAQVAPEYADGVAWIELAPLSNPELLPQQVAAGLGLRDQGGRPVVEALLNLVREQTLLLVLDNCEHLIDACAQLAEALLRGAPGLRILATSREALGSAGERAWLVPALSLPDPESSRAEAVGRAEAVQLFVERAQDVVPTFELTQANAAAVSQICRRLDGIPLALELAAARIRVLTPEQIAARLDDAFRLLTSGSRTALPRHRTLRAVIDWSYELLDEEKQILLRRLAIFSGSFSLEAAEAVCTGGEIEEFEVLDLIAALVDRSMVVMQEVGGTARYSLLETVRQYGLERLEAAGETEELRQRHADFFCALVKQAEPHFTTPERRRWVDHVHRDIDNVRQALAWTRENDPEMHLRLNAMLVWFWFSTRYWVEGRRWAEGALELPEAAAPTRGRAGTLFVIGALATLQGQAALSRPVLEESAAIAASLGDPRLEAYAKNYLGMALVTQGLPEGQAPTEAAMAWYRQAGDLYGLRLSLLILGSLALAKGEIARAAELMEEGVSVARTFGQDRELAIALQSLGEVYLQQPDLPRAVTLFQEALAALRRDPFPLFIARTLEMLATARCDQGAMQEGARLYGAAAAIRETIGAAPFPRDQARYEPRIAAARAALGEEAFARIRAEGGEMTIEEAIDQALAAREPAPAAAPPVAPQPAPPPAQPVPAVAPAPAASAAPISTTALRVLALGPLEIYREGELLSAEVWRYAKPKELLLYLLTHPEGRTKEQIGLVFWPDSSAAQVKNSFHVTLHHLRKALGHSEWIVLENERYRLSPELEIEFDAALFEQRMSAALREVRAGSGAAERLRAVLALYRGDFLQDETVGDWHLDTRDHLRHLYVDGLLALGELLMQAEQWGEAAEVYQRIVRIEDLHEEAHRRLILCLARSGERARALRHYERLVVLLREELDGEPEEETTELYKQLRGSAPA